MSLQHFKLKYGKGTVEFDLPEERVLNVVEGSEYPAIEDIEGALLEGLDNPIGTPALKDIVKPGESVCIVVSDVTRAWIGYQRFLPTLLNYLNAAGKSMSDQELEQMLSAMQSNQQIQRDGDEFKLSMHYQYGEKKFLTGQ